MEPTVVFGKTPFLQSTKGKLTILGAGLLLLLLVLLALSYFNIIPNRKPSNELTTDSIKRVGADESKVRQDIMDIISPSIRPEYQPDEVKVVNLSHEQFESITENIFLTIWDATDGTNFQVFVRYRNDNLSPESRQIFIGIPEEGVEKLDSSSANPLATQYLSLTIQTSFNCSVVNTSPELILCQAESDSIKGKNITVQVLHPFKKP